MVCVFYYYAGCVSNINSDFNYSCCNEYFCFSFAEVFKNFFLFFFRNFSVNKGTGNPRVNLI